MQHSYDSYLTIVFDSIRSSLHHVNKMIKSMAKQFFIGNVEVGDELPVFVIAEMSANHCGSKEKAHELIKEAARAGANAVKLQTYTPDAITLNSRSDDFVIKSGPWGDHGTLWELYEKAYTPYEWHKELYEAARAYGLEIFSSPFDEGAVDFLETLETPAYKIASPEITHIPLLKRVALTKKPVILSTGLATIDDIQLAVQTLRDHGTADIAILKCTTEYPAPLEESNLLSMKWLSTEFDCTVGLSDHTIGNIAAVTAVALGGKIIEKHMCLEKDDDSVDSFFSHDKSEFKEMVRAIREVEMVLGEKYYSLSESALKNRRGMRSIYVSSDIRKGEIISHENTKCVRPAHGLHPKFYADVIGRKVLRSLKAGDRLKMEDLSND